MLELCNLRASTRTNTLAVMVADSPTGVARFA